MQKIHYVSSLPGTGKTHWAVKRLAQHIYKKDGVVLYVAPTIRLQNEIEKYLVEALPPQFKGKVINLNSNSIDVSVIQTLIISLEGAETKDSRGRSLQAACDGMVYIISHASFIAIKSFPNPGRITVYFDEARHLVALIAKIQLHSEKEITAFNTYIKPNLNNNTFTKLTCSEEDNRTIKSTLISTAAKRQFDTIDKVVDSATNPRVDIYAKARAGKYSFYEAKLPIHIFQGFRYVVVMASHFEQSQMYAMLKNTDCELIDITETLNLDETRIINRYMMTTCYPLLDIPYGVTSTMYDGMLIDSNKREQVLQRLKEITPLSVESLAGVVRNPTRFDLEKEDKAEAMAFLKDNGVIEDPFKYLLQKSFTLARKVSDDAPLLVINKRHRSYAIDLLKNNLDYTEGMDYYILPGKPQGLNIYSERTCVIFLAACNPSPELIQLFGHLLPHYDWKMDFSADYILQAVTRSNIRKTGSLKPVHIITADSLLADTLNVKLRGFMNIDTSHTKSKVKLSQRNVIPESEKAGRSDARVKALRSTEIGARLNVLTNARYRCKRLIERLELELSYEYNHKSQLRLNKARERLGAIEQEAAAARQPDRGTS